MEVEWTCVRAYYQTNETTNDTTFYVQLCPHLLVISIIPALLSLFTIFGNIFVLVAVLTNDKLKKRITSVLICNLALADLMVGSVVMPLALMTLVTNGQWIFSRLMCRIWISLDVICCTASIVTLCVISMDRFLGVTTPIQYATRITKGRLKVCSVGVWVFSFLVLLGTIRWEFESDAEIETCDVGEELRYVTHSVVASFFIPLVIILGVYYKIYRVTKRRERSLLQNLFQFTQARKQSVATGSPLPARTTNGPNATDSVPQTPKRKSMMFFPLRMHYGGGESQMEKQRRFYVKHKKSAKTLGIVVGSFIICWFPFFLLYLISHFCDNCIPMGVMHFTTWLGYANSSLNPIIYSVSMRSFRTTFRELCDHMFCASFWSFICSSSFHRRSFKMTRRRIRRSMRVLRFRNPSKTKSESVSSEDQAGESSLSMGSCHALEEDDGRSSTSIGIQNLSRIWKDPDPQRLSLAKQRDSCYNSGTARTDRRRSTTLIISNPSAREMDEKPIQLSDFLSLCNQRNSPRKRASLRFTEEHFIQEVSENETSSKHKHSQEDTKNAQKPTPPIVITDTSSIMNLKLYSMLVSNKVTEL